MNAERYNRVDRIAQAAVELCADERAAYLDSACEGDAELRREVESVILYQQKANSFLEETALVHAAQIMADDRDESFDGLAIANYKIERRIGAGGMGEVYLAQDTKLERKVAIKFLPSEIADDEVARKRLVREARAAASLDHPNICTVHEVNEQDSLTFIVMQYVDGETLSSRIERGPLDTEEVLEVAVQMADALADAHSHGIIHRDIKPQNVMLTARHQVKVLDFGLAEVVRDRSLLESEAVTESLLTEPGMIVGTVSYMSPEQLRGEAIDSRSDIFSFGIVMYEMITGHHPFARESYAETIAAIQMVEPGLLRSHKEEAAEDLQSIVDRSLRKDPGERYQTAVELLADIKRLKHRLEFEQELEHSLPPNTGEGGLAPRQAVATATYLRGVLKRNRPGLMIGAAALVLAVAALVYLSYSPTNSKEIDSIAILPLVNAGNDAETEYLSDGITESLINSLSQFSQLKVVARTTAFRYKGKDIDPRQVGRELRVRAVMTGRLIQRGDRLALQVDLVETGEGSQIWGEQYDRNMSELLAVRQELARDISERLGLRSKEGDEKRLTRGDAANTEAYQFYLKGRHFWNRRTAANLKKAIEQFEQAVEKDPNYALAYVGLADCYSLLEQHAGIPASETLPKARAFANRALQIDDTLSEAHASSAFIYQNQWRWAEAEKGYKRAISLNPNYATAHHWFAIYLRTKRQFDDDIREIKRAQELDPLSPAISAVVAVAYLLKNDLESGIEQCRKIIELDPGFSYAHFILGWAYLKQQRYQEAIAEYQKAVELSGRASFLLGQLGYCYAVTERHAEALQILKELEEKYAMRESVGLHLAYTYAGLGDKDRAFAWLERDFEQRSGELELVTSMFNFEVLRSDPRYTELVRRMGILN